MNRIINFLIKYVWQFPQILLALLLYSINRKNILYNYKGNLYTAYVGTNMCGITLGDKIFIGKPYHGEYLNLIIAHESGHVLQSKYLGPLYLLLIILPLLVWKGLHKTLFSNKNYYWFYTENWANKLGGVGLTKEGTLTWKHLIRK